MRKKNNSKTMKQVVAPVETKKRRSKDTCSVRAKD